MRLVNIDQLINVKLYDERERAWKEKRMTVEAFLNASSSDALSILEVESIEADYDKGKLELKVLRSKMI